MRYEEYTGNGAGMQRSPADIEADLQAIREEMSETLRQLEERFSPREVVERLFDRARHLGGGSSDFLKNLGATVRDNPVPVLLLASGVASLLMSERMGPTGEERPRRGRTSGDGIQERIGALSSAAQEAAGKVSEQTGEVASRARVRTAEVRGRMRDAVKEARDRGSRAVQEQPMVVLGLGLAAGAILRSLLPAGEEMDKEPPGGTASK